MRIMTFQRFNRMFLLALVSSLCLLSAQSTMAGQYQGWGGAVITCPDNTHLVATPAHWDRSGNMIAAKYLCVPLYHPHYRYDNAVVDYSTTN